jgi:hypothetical protein
MVLLKNIELIFNIGLFLENLYLTKTNLKEIE